MRVGYLITARLKSTRLPRKLLREIKGKPVISHMIDRLKLAKHVDQIIICTSSKPQDAPLMDIAEENGVSCFCGDPDDVIARLYSASALHGLDYILNITGDCPFVDPIYADKVVEEFVRTDADLIRVFDLPHGAFSYGISPASLKKVIEIKENTDTEVWGRYFTDTDLFTVVDMEVENDFHRKPHLRMTLDYPEDLAFFEAVFDYLYVPGAVFSLDDILQLLEKRPEIIEINRGCADAFKKRFDRQSEICLKQRYSISKAAIIGCGSIGQRHIKNLRNLGVLDITALRTQKGHFQRLPEECAVKEVYELQDLLEGDYDIAIVSNPTSLHLETAQQVLPYVKGLFVEKPLSHTLKGVKEFIKSVQYHKVVTFVGHNLQFHPAIKAVRKVLYEEDFGNPLTFQCQAGHWLQEWHPYEDYKDAYYAKKALGGGATLTLIHEINLAISLFGAVIAVNSFFTKNSLLNLDVDTVADLMVKHRSGVCSQIHLDFIQRPLHRRGVISCEKGWISYDIGNGNVMAQLSTDKKPSCLWQDNDYDPNLQYLDEIDKFLAYVKEGRMRHPFDAWQAVQSLAVAEVALEQEDMTSSALQVPLWVQKLS